MPERKKRTAAIIPARGGSKGIQYKNIALLGGVPLITWSVQVALQAKLVDRVFVTTNDPIIAQTAKESGAEIPFLRPNDLAGDTASVKTAIDHLLAELKKDGEVFDIVVTLFPTSPFRTPAMIDEAIRCVSTETFQYHSVVYNYIDTKKWFHKNKSNWEMIRSPNAGLVCNMSALINVGANNLTNKFENEEERFRHISTCLDGTDLRYLNGPYYLPLTSDSQLVDIDTNADLERANRLIDSGEIEWAPEGVKIGASKSDLERYSIFKHQAKQQCVWISTFNSKTIDLTSETKLLNPDISSPYAFRAFVDKNTNFAGQPIFAKTSESNPFPIYNLPDMATLWLDPEQKFEHRVYHVLTSYDSGFRWLGINEPPNISTLFGNIKITPHRDHISIDLPSIIKIGDIVRIIARSHTGENIGSPYNYRFTGKTFEQGHRILEHQISDRLEITFDGYKIIARFSEEILFATVRLFRNEIPNKQGNIFLEPNIINECISYDSNHHNYINEQTGEIIQGRQQLPDIICWSGYAYLPATIPTSSEWKIEILPKA